MSIYEADENIRDLLSDGELAALLETAVKTKGEISEEDATCLVDWAHDIRLQALTLDMAIKGQIGIAWGAGEPNFVHPKYAKGPLR